MTIQRNLNTWVNGDAGREAVRRTIAEMDQRIKRIELLASTVKSTNGNGNGGGLTAQQRSDVAGLIGALSQSVIGVGVSDPVLPGQVGGGSVTSFSAGDLSPLFTTSETNVTTTPALAFSQIVQSPNRIFAGPASGGAANPTFRSLVADDLPAANLNIPEIIADQTLADADDGFWVDATAGVVQVTLTPAATAQIKRYVFKKMDASANAMTIKVDGGTADTIDGAASISTIVQYTAMTLIPDPVAGTWNITV